jgi:histidine triad (HIT) family protein
MNPKQTKTDCVFCKIVAGEIPSKVLYQDESVLVFPDINPAAPIHLLIIPKKHIASVLEMTEADTQLISHLILVANQMAREQGIAKRGFRLVINCGKEGRQLVQHLHVHLLGGEPLRSHL